MQSFIQACAQCGRDYEARISRSRYCSGSCRAQASTDRRLEEFRRRSADLVERALAAASAGDAGALEALAAEVAAFRP